MSFLSPGYLLFFPATVLLYFLLPRPCKNLWLLAASWFFYLCAGPDCFAFLLCATLVTYTGARLLERRDGAGRKALLTLLLTLLFGTLFLFKYLDFAFSLAERVLDAAGLSFSSPALDLILPAGISFYLFMAAGYLIDVYRGDRAAEHSFLLCALFLSFFPHVISGPIARAGGLIPQFREVHRFDYDKFRAGLLRFLWGAFKKLCIADRLAVLVNAVFAAPGDFGWLQVIRSIAEFWRRWHISLSAWFRDYLYIPLGGSRRGRTRKYLNILLVFAVSGLWHGAALTFVVWGLLNGIYQVAGGLTARLRARCRQSLRMREDRPLTVLWQMAVTFVLATLAWVFFKAGSLSGALSVLRAMLPAGPALVHPVLASMGLDRREFLAAALAGLTLLAVDLLSLRGSVRARVLALPRPLRWLVALILLLCVFLFGVYGTGYDPQDFIYFKF